MDALRGRAVRRQREVARAAQRIDAQEARVAAAARDVRLHDVDRVVLEQALEVEDVPAVLAGGDRHARRPLAADLREPVQVVAGHGLLEPDDALSAYHCAQCWASFTGRRRWRPRAARCRRRSPRGPSGRDRDRVGLAPDLHLHARDALRHPARELLLQALLVVVAEAAGAVDVRVLVDVAEHGHERHVEQPGEQVPERVVDRRDRHRDHAGGPGVAAGPCIAPRSRAGAARRRRTRSARACPGCRSRSPRGRTCSRGRCARPRGPARRRRSSSPTPACRRPPCRPARRWGACGPRRRSLRRWWGSWLRPTRPDG